MKFFLLFVPTLAALWVFFDSQKRGYSIGKGLLWAIGVFFVMIVFLPLYLAVRNRKQRTASPPSSQRDSAPPTPCFYCGRPYEGNPKLCPHCGQNLKF
ncbi:MAG: hypothetical protein NTV04_15545 [Deltaproteobacteria bacterium]|nr:hypothetical protein [Deltaproteobacteria bacterium]